MPLRNDWFIRVDGRKLGPFSTDRLRVLVGLGRVTADTPVRKGSDGRWVSAGQVQGLFSTKPETQMVLPQATKAEPEAVSAVEEPSVTASDIPRNVEPADNVWFYKDGEYERGPISQEHLVEIIAQGWIGPNTPVRRGLSGDWILAKWDSEITIPEWRDTPDPKGTGGIIHSDPLPPNPGLPGMTGSMGGLAQTRQQAPKAPVLRIPMLAPTAATASAPPQQVLKPPPPSATSDVTIPTVRQSTSAFSNIGLSVLISIIVVSFAAQLVNQRGNAVIEAGQFLSKPGAAITFLSGLGIVGIILTWLTLQTARQKYLARLLPTMTDDVFIKAIGLGAVISLGLTLVLQALSITFFGVAVEVMEAPANQVSQLPSSSVPRTAAVRGGARAVVGLGKGLTKNPKAAGVAAFIAAIVILLFIVGAGYVFSALELSFFSHFIAFSLGVGLVEEFTKAVASVAIFYGVFRQLPVGDAQGHRKRVMAAFGLAGLGFGAGEALHYFGIYNDMGSGIESYALRAVWCVALHCCWTMITGAIIASWLPAVWDNSVGLRKASGVILASCVPSLILHGFYDAACIHGSGLYLVTGIVSIIAAYAVFESTFEQDAPQVLP